MTRKAGREALRREGGSVSAEVVVAAPALMFLILLATQFGLWYHGANVARAAAEEGVGAARMEGATAGDGEAEARDFLAQVGSGVVTDPRVSAARDADTARVEVSGTAVSVLPGFHLPIRAKSESPVERWRPVPPSQ